MAHAASKVSDSWGRAMASACSKVTRSDSPAFEARSCPARTCAALTVTPSTLAPDSVPIRTVGGLCRSRRPASAVPAAAR